MRMYSIIITIVLLFATCCYVHAQDADTVKLYIVEVYSDGEEIASYKTTAIGRNENLNMIQFIPIGEKYHVYVSGTIIIKTLK